MAFRKNSFFLSVFILCMVISNTDAYWIRTYVLTSCGQSIWCLKQVWYCPGLNSYRGMVKNTQIKNLPCTFTNYDIDNNGGIDFQEFVKTLKLKIDKKASNQNVFGLVDANNDGILSCNELKNAPFSFRCVVFCQS